MGMFAGIYDLIRAIMMILTRPKLISLMLIPSFVCLLLSVGSTALCVSYSDEVLNWIFGEGWSSSDSLIWTIASGAVWGMGALLSLVITPWLVILIGGPLCGPLADAVDEQLGGSAVEQGALKSLTSGLKVSILIVLIGLSGAVGLFTLSLVPGLGAFAAPFNFLIWTPFFLCFDLCDPVFSRRALSLSERMKGLRGHFLSTLSVGIVALLLITPPVVNLIGFPIAVVMGTLHAHRIGA
jgi:uncharacterized protein involved in cysteine biosynthesis